MSSPRKFSEKIALLQQKKVEADAAFNTILHEVEAVKQQKTDRKLSTKTKLDVPKRKYDYLEKSNNGMINYPNQSIKMENNNGSDRLSLPADHFAWRRTYSDSSLHQTIMPNGNSHQCIPYNDNNQSFNGDMKVIPPPPYNAHNFPMTNSQCEQSPDFDLNNNNYVNDRINFFQQPVNNPHVGMRFTNGNQSSNVLMLPPHQYPRGGGSLPDLRLDNSVYSDSNALSSTSISQHNSNGDLFMLDPQQQKQCHVGPVKQNTSMRRRHSPIGEIRTRQHSPTSECSPKQPNLHRIEPQSPQSQSSYSPQNSPHLLSSPINELSQHSNENSQHYFNLPNNFDQISLDNNFYMKQQQQPSSPSSQQTHHQSLPTTPSNTNYYPPFVDNLQTPYQYSPTTNLNVKSPTIPDITFTDVDSSKTDLPTDFSNSFDNFITETDFNLTTEDFMLNGVDLTSDINISDSNFRLER